MIAICVLLAGYAVIMGFVSIGWTIRMQKMEYFCLPNESYEMQSFSCDGVTYECLPLPEGTDEAVIRERIDPSDYDDVVESDEGDMTYLLFRDPFETGEDKIFLLPVARLGGDKMPLAFYVREVKGA